MTYRELRRTLGLGAGATTTVAKAADQRRVCAKKSADGYLCTRPPGNHHIHVAHAGDDAPDGTPQSLVEWEGDWAGDL